MEHDGGGTWGRWRLNLIVPFVVLVASLTVWWTTRTLPLVPRGGGTWPGVKAEQLEDFKDHLRDGTVVCLLIGVQERASTTNERFGLKNDLRFVRSDTDLLASGFATLGLPPQNILTLVDESASRAAIFDQFKKLDQYLQKDDRLILAFLGHGITDDAGKSQLILYDGTITAEELLVESSKLPCSHRLLLMDACHSGAPGRPEIRLPAEALRTGGSVTWIASSSPEQFSYEDPTLEHGLFTYHFSQVMASAEYNDANKDGWLSVDEIGIPLADQVAKAARRKGLDQIPLYGTEQSIGATKLIPAPRRWAIKVMGRGLRPQARCLFPVALPQGSTVWVVVAPKATGGRIYPQNGWLPKDGPEITVPIQLGESAQNINEEFDVLLLECDAPGAATLKSARAQRGIPIDAEHMQLRAQANVIREY